MHGPDITLLDGSMGAVLEALGADCSGSAWSARAVIQHPEQVERLHRAYVEAGVEVLTACTFRTTPRAMGDGWRDALQRAVALARAGSLGRAEASSGGTGVPSVCPGSPERVRVAGSIAPLEDCWRPDLSPGRAGRAEHAALAGALAEAGCDLLLCETFANVDEAAVATEAAMATGLPVWTSLTPGYRADLLTAEDLEAAGRRVFEAGAEAVLINCVPVERALEYVQALRAGVAASTPIGCYANGGQGLPTPESCRGYAQAAARWVEAGARIVGGCCGVWPEHIAALGAMLGKGRGGIRTHE
ncbi:MAG: homocysteine S-methyltransferase family protein [Phycisphaerales bacterium]|nr:homocysteine S-methyltransferase family protein [Phycisphaerales bacterium]